MSDVIQVDFNTELQQDVLAPSVLLKQRLPVKKIKLSERTRTSHVSNYSGCPVQCRFQNDFNMFHFPFRCDEGDKASFPVVLSPILLNESDASSAFYANVLTPLQVCLKDFNVQSQYQMDENLRNDFALLNLESEPFVIIEMKPCTAFSDLDRTTFKDLSDLDKIEALTESVNFGVTDWDEKFLQSRMITKENEQSEPDSRFNLRMGLRQLSYYMCKVSTGKAFGILSSYCLTYLVILQRHNPDEIPVLFISPALKFSNEDVLEKIAEFIQKAHNTERKVIKKRTSVISLRHTGSTSALKDGEKEGENKNRKRRRILQNADLGDSNQDVPLSSNPTTQNREYTIGKTIGEGRCGCVFQVYDQNGQPFAAKCISDKCGEDIIMELCNEEEIYDKLDSLQGMVVPKLHFSGYLDGWRKVLVMDLLVADVLYKCNKLSDKEKAAITSALKKIHDRQILHGDIREDNILLGRSKEDHMPQAYFIDFAFSKENNSEEAFKNEQEELKILLSRH